MAGYLVFIDTAQLFPLVFVKRLYAPRQICGQLTIRSELGKIGFTLQVGRLRRIQFRNQEDKV